MLLVTWCLCSVMLAACANTTEAPVRVIPRPTSWMLTIERTDEAEDARSAAMTVYGERQLHSAVNATGARCERLTDGTNIWDIAVETSYVAVEGGVEATIRIENRSDRWRVVSVSGCETCLTGARPESMSLYVPEGLGKRVNPLRSAAKLSDCAKYDESKWQNAQWFRQGKDGLFFGTGWYSGAMGLTLPFVAMADERRGFYLGQHDPTGRVVRFELSRSSPCADLVARSVLRTPVGPGEMYVTPKTVCVGFEGDWRMAPKLYRSWQGTNRPMSSHPDWIREVSGWLLVIMRQQNGEVIWNYSDMSQICDVADANGLDMIGLFGWTEGGHDHLYPDYCVSDEMGGANGLREAIGLAHRRGKRVCLYANGQLQQVDGSTFWQTDGHRIALTDRTGSRHLQQYPKFKNIPKYDFALGCLHAPAWRQRMLSLAEQACDFGADGILYDQLGMTRPWLCYGEGHGHPVPANSYESERPGFIREIRERLLRRNPSFVLMTEGLHDTIADSIACFHGCETGCFQTRLSWEPDFTWGADAWTKVYVHEADARFRDDPGINTVFPELYRLTFPDLVTTVRIPSPLVDRTMVNWTLLYGLRHDIELRYAPDRAYVLGEKVPSKDDYSLVCSPPDIARMNHLERQGAAEYLCRANAFQKRFSSLLLKGRYEDEHGLRLKSSGRILAKRYAGADGTCGVMIWNLDSVPHGLSLEVDGMNPQRAAGLSGDVPLDAPVDANEIRLFLFGASPKR